MTTRTLNIILCLAFIASLGLNWRANREPAKTNVEYFPDMAHSARYNTFAANPNFADGKTLRSPEPGTIPRGLLPVHFQPTPQDAARAGEEFENPLRPDDARARERGATVYANFCQTCHGPQGKGDGPVALRGFPPPASLLADKARNFKDGQMFHVLTYGQGNMPSYAGQISREDRWKVIAYVRQLQRQSAPAPAGIKP